MVDECKAPRLLMRRACHALAVAGGVLIAAVAVLAGSVGKRNRLGGGRRGNALGESVERAVLGNVLAVAVLRLAEAPPPPTEVGMPDG